MKKKIFLILYISLSLCFVINNFGYARTPDWGQPLPPPEPENLSLCVLYKNGTLVKGSAWDDIIWKEVDQVGIRNQYAVGGFESDYGSIVWYLRDHTAGITYDRPLFFVFQRFWAKVGGNWYRNYITTDAQKMPFKKVSNEEEWMIGWSGEIDYAGYNFPVSLGLLARKEEPYAWLKTNVTSPIALQDHAIEYQMYLNPQYASDAQRYIRYLRVYFINGTTKDLDIQQVMDVTTDIPEMVSRFTFLNEAKSIEICSFDFGDVFGQGVTNLAKIESVTLPNGVNTYVIKIGSTFGPLGAGETMVIDPIFGYTGTGSSSSSLDDYVRGSVFTAPKDGTVQSITGYFQCVGTVGYKRWVRFGMYRHSDLSLLGTTDAVQVWVSSPTWGTLHFDPDVEVTGGTEYILVAQGEGDLNAEMVLYYHTGDTNQGHYQSYSYWAGLPDPLVPTHDNNEYCLYATYTPYSPVNDAVESDDLFVPTNYGWVNVTVSDQSGFDDITEIELEVNTTGDAETFTLNWTETGLQEEYSEYTEVDEDSDITVTSSDITVDTMQKEAVSYVYKDMGAGHFSGDFEHLVDFKWTAQSDMDSFMGVWMVADGIGATEQLKSAHVNHLAVYTWWQGADLNYKRLYLKEVYDGTNYPSTPQYYVIDKNTTYYLTIARSGSSVTLEIYSDSARNTLLETLTVASLQSVEAYSYIYGVISSSGSGTDTVSGYITNLRLQEEFFAEVSDSSGICTLDTSTSTNSTIDSDTIKVSFYFKFASNATLGACDVEVTSTDSQDNTDVDSYNSLFTLKLLTLSVQSKDSEGNVLTATTVFMNNGSLYNITVDSNGWANFTGISSLNVTLYATWYGLTVNTSHTLSFSDDTEYALNCSAYPFVYSGTTYHVASDAAISAADYASNQLTVQFSSNESTYIMIVTGSKPTYLQNVVYDLSQNYTTYLNVTHYSNTTIVVDYSNWGGTYIQSANQLITDILLLEQKLYITSSGTTGESGQIEIYCGSKGQPVNHDGFTSTDYSTSTTIFSGSYVFSSTKIVWVDWAGAGETPPGGPQGGMVAPQLVLYFPKLQIAEPLTRGSIKHVEIEIEYTNPSVAVLYVTDVNFGDYAIWFSVEDELPIRVLKLTNEAGTITVPLRLLVPKGAEVGSHEIACEVVIREGSVDHVARSYITLSVSQVTPTIPGDVMPILFLVVIGGFLASTIIRLKKKKS